METKPIYFADDLFFWTRIGKRPTVLEIKCILTEEVDPSALKTALLNALRVHTNFRIKPVVADEKFRVVVEDVKIPPLFKKDGRIRQLATEETEGLLLYVTYDGKEVTLHIHHGVSDFRGMLAFLNTLLKYYYHELGENVGELPEPDSANWISCFEDVINKGAPGAPLGFFVPDPDKVFHIPEENFGKHTTMQRILEIDVPLEPLLALSKGSDSSLAPTVQAFVGRAIHRTYEVGDKDVIGYTPVDLRPIFNFETSGNGASNFPLRYAAALDHYDLNERAMYLRTILDVQIMPENLYARVKSTMDKLNPVINDSIPIENKTKLIVNDIRQRDTGIYTYGFSYAGKVKLDDKLASHVTSVTNCAGSYSYPLWLISCELDGILRIMLVQAYESDVLAKNIYKELADHIPGTSFKDWGHHEFDEFHLSNIPRVK